MLSRCVGFCFFLLFWVANVSATSGVLDERGRPLPEVVNIFRLLSPLLEPNREMDAYQTLVEGGSKPLSTESLLALGATLLKCPKGMETWDPRFIRQFTPYDTPEIRKLFDEIGFFKKTEPVLTFPVDYLLVFGGVVETLQARVQSLGIFYQQDLFKVNPSTQVLFLGTDRPLNLFETAQLRQVNPRSAVLPKTQLQAFEWLLEFQPFPKGLQDLNTFCVLKLPGFQKNLPPKDITEHTMLVNWLKTRPKPGHCLILSNQPFVSCHQALLNTVFLKLSRQKWSFEVVGDKPAKRIPLAILVDTLIRTMELESLLKGARSKSTPKTKGSKGKI